MALSSGQISHGSKWDSMYRNVCTERLYLNLIVFCSMYKRFPNLKPTYTLYAQ